MLLFIRKKRLGNDVQFKINHNQLKTIKITQDSWVKTEEYDYRIRTVPSSVKTIDILLKQCTKIIGVRFEK